MIVERKRRRDIWFSALTNSAPDFVIAAIAAVVIGGEGWIAFLGVLAGLHVLYFIVWLRKTIWIWIRYWVIDKNRAIKATLENLNEARFPHLGNVYSADDYFQIVSSGKEFDIELRIKASETLAIMSYLAATGRLQESIRMSFVLDAALEQYKGPPSHEREA